MCVSVKPRQTRIGADGLSKDSVERVSRPRAFEAGDAAAGVGAAPGALRARRQLALARDEAQQLRPRRLAAAAGARPGWGAHAASRPLSVVSGSLGVPARASSGRAAT